MNGKGRQKAAPTALARPGEEPWAAWMAAAQGGDGAAYQKLLGAVLPELRRFVGGRLGDPGSVEDVVQNVLLSIHQARHTYRPERPFGPWMRAIARNAVIDAQRARSQRLRREARIDPDDSREPSVEAFEIDEGLSPALARALEELPPKQRQAVELLHLRELSVIEAASHVGVSPSALKVRAHRGYKALRARLADRRNELG